VQSHSCSASKLLVALIRIRTLLCKLTDPRKTESRSASKATFLLCLWWIRVLKTQAYWHATPCRLVNIYQLSDESNASTFKQKHSRKSRLLGRKEEGIANLQNDCNCIYQSTWFGIREASSLQQVLYNYGKFSILSQYFVSKDWGNFRHLQI
jgi:hypothetical protein